MKYVVVFKHMISFTIFLQFHLPFIYHRQPICINTMVLNRRRPISPTIHNNWPLFWTGNKSRDSKKRSYESCDTLNCHWWAVTLLSKLISH